MEYITYASIINFIIYYTSFYFWSVLHLELLNILTQMEVLNYTEKVGKCLGVMK